VRHRAALSTRSGDETPPDAAKQKAMLDKVYPEACALTNKANDYFVYRTDRAPAGGSFAGGDASMMFADR